jgi:hypothetical protein
MSRAPDALQIELRFRNAASQLINIAIGASPAICRANTPTSSDNAGSEMTGRLKPCRRAFCAACALPRSVFGPVLACAFARFELLFRPLNMLVSCEAFDHSGLSLNCLEVCILNFV